MALSADKGHGLASYLASGTAMNQGNPWVCSARPGGPRTPSKTSESRILWSLWKMLFFSLFQNLSNPFSISINLNLPRLIYQNIICGWEILKKHGCDWQILSWSRQITVSFMMMTFPQPPKPTCKLTCWKIVIGDTKLLLFFHIQHRKTRSTQR